MTTVRELHHKAMSLFNQAESMFRRKSDGPAMSDLYCQSALKEAEAARMIPPDASSEPTRGILYVSAGSIALRGEDFDLAMQMADEGLAGFPCERDRKDLVFIGSLAKSKRGGSWVKPALPSQEVEM